VRVLLAQVSDTHLLSDPRTSVWGRNPAENLASVMNALPPVDATVVTGDIADDGTIEAYRLADRLTQRSAPRRYFIAGNHDDAAAMATVFGEIEDWRLVSLSEQWALGLLNSQWIGHEGGCITDRTLARLRRALDRVQAHVVLCLHHPPLSPCVQPDCGLIGRDRLLRVLRGGPVRVVLSGHVHQHFEARYEGITFLGAPSTLSQLRHGGTPHYTDTGEPPGAQLLDLHDDGDVDHRVVTSGA
jgi:3',5'-cyclic-AMP phosphodiesterase